jgi:transcription-repair coupling factor (superfamily II helicase)
MIQALDSLSSTNWTSKKDKAKARIYDHASEILKIEADRLKSNIISPQGL